ncbi:hypothetical protein F8M41_000474 [Gigaspora margarita]|uniref:Uncharacterized protein n=1 Tax=Gigaspora margarita TaxID=4874 RepID=A0A8H4AZN6_GIGMA|nr:hypothetical protein F8M41_000474 [Gigaspora margarita]
MQCKLYLQDLGLALLGRHNRSSFEQYYHWSWRRYYHCPWGVIIVGIGGVTIIGPGSSGNIGSEDLIFLVLGVVLSLVLIFRS